MALLLLMTPRVRTLHKRHWPAWALACAGLLGAAWPAVHAASLGPGSNSAVVEQALDAVAALRVGWREPARVGLHTRRATAPSQAKQARQAPLGTAPAARRALRWAGSAARLQLDLPLPVVASRGPVERAFEAVAQATAAARQSASAASAAAERIANLEHTVERLRGENQSHRSQAEQLREQLAQAESGGGLQWWLGAAVLLLSGLALWLTLRLAAARRAQRAAWQMAADEARRAHAHTESPTRPPTSAMAFVHSEFEPSQSGVLRGAPAPAWPPPAPPDGFAPSQPPDEGPVTRPPSPLVVRSFRGPSTGAAAAHAAGEGASAMQTTAVLPPPGRAEAAGPRDVSIDELMDLEQQAEFFVVLGQDDAAIDLLVEHLRHTGGGSPLPYLKLLEIHRRRGDRSDYERMRARFNHRFNAYAPEWEVDLHSGRMLHEYPGVLHRLAQVWPRPLDSMAELEAMMFRKSRGEVFDLPAYREVLFLYTVARDLLDRGSAETGTVDLLLPMADGGAFSTTSPAPFLDLGRDSGQASLDFEDRPTAPVDLDLSFEGERATSIFDPLQEAPTHPRRH